MEMAKNTWHSYKLKVKTLKTTYELKSKLVDMINPKTCIKKSSTSWGAGGGGGGGGAPPRADRATDAERTPSRECSP
jgi:hypothetical protein